MLWVLQRARILRGLTLLSYYYFLQKKLQSVGIEAISSYFFHIWSSKFFFLLLYEHSAISFAIALIMFKFQGEAKQHLLSLMDDKSEVLGCNHTFPINNAMSIAPCTLYHIFMPWFHFITAANISLTTLFCYWPCQMFQDTLPFSLYYYNVSQQSLLNMAPVLKRKCLHWLDSKLKFHLGWNCPCILCAYRNTHREYLGGGEIWGGTWSFTE